jgi:hypothetical protein
MVAIGIPPDMMGSEYTITKWSTYEPRELTVPSMNTIS